MAGARNQFSPHSSSRRRRALSEPSEERASRLKSHSLKRKLNFEQTIEQSIQQDLGHPTQQSTGKNILNLPYSDSESEEKDQCPAIKSSEQLAACAQNYETLKHIEQGESSKKPRPNKSHRIKDLKEVIAQQEVLERVIKDRYKRLSDNFAKTNVAFESLAKESIKEKKKKEKLINNCSRLRLLARHLKKRIRGLKQKLKQRSHLDLQFLAQVAVNMQGEKSDVN
jgi:hypothetical protein